MGRRRWIVVAVLVCVAAALFHSPTAPGRKAIYLARSMECFKRPGHGGVAAAGDSITAGSSDADWGFLGHNSWFNQAVCNEGVEYAYNAAVPNHTTAQVAADLAEALDRDPDVVVILTGTNDVLRHRSLRGAVAAIRAIVERVRRVGATPVVATLPPFARQAAHVGHFNRQLLRMAHAEHAAWIDFHAVLADGDRYAAGMSDDGLHPSERGARAMANVAAPILRRAAR